MFNPNLELFKNEIKGKKIAVLGLGVSNLPAIEFLYKNGAIITGCDKNDFSSFSEEALNVINRCCKNTNLGETYLDNLSDYDIVLKSPGINPANPKIKAALDSDVVVTSEMEIFMSLCPCKIIAVTGSDGKTTTTSLIYEILKEQGLNCYVGGNIGSPLLSKIEYINEDDYVVLELSSFQLMLMDQSPDISVITNISPNHLDYHKDMQEYIEAKANIFKYQDETAKLIINADNDVTASFAGREIGELICFSRKSRTHGAYVENNCIMYDGEFVMNVSDILLKGVHNLENYLAAVSATYGIVDNSVMQTVARNFKGVPHRMEHVRKIGGINFYNDSIGSSPTRTIAGLEAHGAPIVLIAGGYDKKLAFDQLGKVIKKRVSALVLCGATSEKIEKAVRDAYTSDETPITIMKTDDFEKAVRIAYALAKAESTKLNENISVILSPACASFDMFKNFEVRGNKFKEIVNSITE